MKGTILEFDLVDDGTLDTVTSVRCFGCGRVWEERFSDTSEYRDSETGVLDFEAFVESMCGDVVCECESD